MTSIELMLRAVMRNQVSIMEAQRKLMTFTVSEHNMGKPTRDAYRDLDSRIDNTKYILENIR